MRYNCFLNPNKIYGPSPHEALFLPDRRRGQTLWRGVVQGFTLSLPFFVSIFERKITRLVEGGSHFLAKLPAAWPSVSLLFSLTALSRWCVFFVATELRPTTCTDMYQIPKSPLSLLTVICAVLVPSQFTTRGPPRGGSTSTRAVKSAAKRNSM